MNPLYNIAVNVAKGVLRLGSGGHGKTARMMRGQAHTLRALRRVPRPDRGNLVVWFHAASLGEFEQGRPMMERLRRERPGTRIVLSFFSPSGYEVRHNWPVADAVVYLPLDTRHDVRAFLDALHPDVAVFIKYEFWANYLAELKARRIPTYIISAIFRADQPFFRRWGGFWRRMLRCFSQIFVQDEASRTLLEKIGVTNVTVAGDTRFDRVADVCATPCRIDGMQQAMRPGALRFIAGSSWPEDEEVYIPWLVSHPDVRFIIAPHEFDTARIASIIDRFPGRKVMSLSQWIGRGRPADVDGLVIDAFGHLSTLYRFADVAYIGGGFGSGIHNINEAAVYGLPVLFGPRHQKFREAAGLIEAGGGFEIVSSESFAATMKRLSDSRFRSLCAAKSHDFIQANLGATDLIYPLIFSDSK